MDDHRRRAELIEQHLPLVRNVMFQVSVRFPNHVDRDELVRAGMLGLVQAAGRYDPDRGVEFESFAAHRIRGAILDALRRDDWAPRTLRHAARSMEATSDQLARQLGRVPTTAETAAASGMTAGQLAALQEQLNRSVLLTLDMTMADADDDEITLGDVVAESADGPEIELENRELHAYLRDAVALLPERHRMVIDGYFFQGRTSEDLARALGVTVSRISQLRSHAFEMLREGIAAQFADEPVPDPASGSGPPRPGRLAQRKAAYASAIAARRTWKSRIEDPAVPARRVAV